ncbi:MAG: FISUMP domain-containing protein, partial [Anaerolineaceae bacterium]|nr:FISUMP domain-containing protein [Anaerolineaceae bacterium]
WMAENLKYNARGSGYYDLNLYGRFYDFKTALNVCPTGWHLPNDSEWKILENDLELISSPQEMDKLRQLDLAAQQKGSRIRWVPTFYAYGRKDY